MVAQWYMGLYHKTYYDRNVQVSVICYSVCPGKSFQSSLVFAGKAVAYLSKAPLRCSTL
jgi:hypothetical protein